MREGACWRARTRQGSGVVVIRAALLATVLVLIPLGAWAADLVVWWEKGWNPEEDQAVRELVAAFERKTGETVELAFQPSQDLPARVLAALEVGRPPDLLSGLIELDDYYPEWAHEGRLVDLSDV